MLVVDASIAVQLALHDGRPDALAAEELIAPALLWSEATSALHELGFRGAIERTVASDAIERLASLGIERRDEPRLHVEASRLARLLGWPKTYDAEYVALASILGARLLTRDARLRRGAARLVTAVGPAELDPTRG
jgi:indolepyruvate ferredoxin oxidoreductase alpha subunit